MHDVEFGDNKIWNLKYSFINKYLIFLLEAISVVAQSYWYLILFYMYQQISIFIFVDIPLLLFTVLLVLLLFFK